MNDLCVIVYSFEIGCVQTIQLDSFYALYHLEDLGTGMQKA